MLRRKEKASCGKMHNMIWLKNVTCLSNHYSPETYLKKAFTMCCFISYFSIWTLGNWFLKNPQNSEIPWFPATWVPGWELGSKCSPMCACRLSSAWSSFSFPCFFHFLLSSSISLSLCICVTWGNYRSGTKKFQDVCL